MHSSRSTPLQRPRWRWRVTGSVVMSTRSPRAEHAVGHSGSHALLPDKSSEWVQLTLSALTPLLPKRVKFQESKVHTYTPANSIFDGPITNLLLNPKLLRTCAKGQKSPNDFFKFGTFIGRFQSEGAASMAVKGLKTWPTFDYVVIWVKQVQYVTMGADRPWRHHRSSVSPWLWSDTSRLTTNENRV